MASKHLFPITTGLHTPPLLLLLLPLVLLLVTARCAVAQPPPLSDNNNKNSYPNTNFNPSMAIVIVVLISAFFFLGFFSIYIRQCADDRLDPRVSVRGSGAARSQRQRGLDPEVLETFPTLVYSEVKGLKIGKGTLECAVCLSEFEDEETLRLLPKCSHVFHPDCIDAWLASHVTCPLCRSNLVPDPNAPEVEITDPPIPLTVAETTDQGPTETPQEVEAPPDHVAITVEDEDRKAEMIDLERIARMKRARSKARPARFARSHSTGHSVIQPGENLDRFTLRLPENIRKEIVAAVMLQRTKSCVAFPAAGEGSSRRGYRGEGSSRAGRSIRLGRSDRWPSVLLRMLSARVPGWATGRRGDPEGSTKAGRRIEPDGSVKVEGSTKGKLTSAVRAPLDCLGGGGAKFNVGADENESSTAAFAWV